MIEKKKIIGVFPGTFDPITFGHLDIIKRAMKITDKLVIAVSGNSKKNILFSAEERVAMIQNEISDELFLSKDFLCNEKKEIEVKIFDGLLVDFVISEGAGLIIRGLRPYYDFGYEFKMSCINKKLKPNLETIFFTTLEENQFISSSLVREVASLGGEIDKFLPEKIATALKEKIKMQKL